MRIKLIAGLISFLLIVLTILLFIEESPKTKIIVSPKIYSIMKSSDNERFKINILVNDSQSYYFNEEYISDIRLSSENEEIIPLTLNSITTTNEGYIYDNNMYYFLTIELSIAFSSEDYLINMDKAYLDIFYTNANIVNLYIGEFNYYFYDEENRDISLNNLMSTHTLINSVDTSSGLFLNLGNLTDYNITISNIEIGSSAVLANNYYLTEIYDIPDNSSIPSQIIGVENYNYSVHLGNLENNILLRKNNEVMLYVPFSYTGDIPYLHRFYVKVHYIIDNEEKVFVIDDFPYINTSNYKEELESEYRYYEFDN